MELNLQNVSVLLKYLKDLPVGIVQIDTLKFKHILSNTLIEFQGESDKMLLTIDLLHRYTPTEAQCWTIVPVKTTAHTVFTIKDKNCCGTLYRFEHPGYYTQLRNSKLIEAVVSKKLGKQFNINELFYYRLTAQEYRAVYNILKDGA